MKLTAVISVVVIELSTVDINFSFSFVFQTNWFIEEVMVGIYIFLLPFSLPVISLLLKLSNSNGDKIRYYRN